MDQSMHPVNSVLQMNWPSGVGSEGTGKIYSENWTEMPLGVEWGTRVQERQERQERTTNIYMANYKPDVEYQSWARICVYLPGLVAIIDHAMSTNVNYTRKRYR